MSLRASLLVILLVSALSIAVISCQLSADDRFSSVAASPTPEVTQTSMVIVVEFGEKVETEKGVEILTRTVRYVVTPVPPLEQLVKVQKVEADHQIEITRVEILPGLELGVDVPGSIPVPSRNISFRIVATSQNNGPARTIRTQITIEDPSTGEKHTTGVDEFVESGGTTGPHLGFFVEPKPWVAYVEVRVIR